MYNSTGLTAVHCHVCGFVCARPTPHDKMGHLCLKVRNFNFLFLVSSFLVFLLMLRDDLMKKDSTEGRTDKKGRDHFDLAKCLINTKIIKRNKRDGHCQAFSVAQHCFEWSEPS